MNDVTDESGGHEGIAGIAMWKKAIVVLSLVLGCVGLALGSSGSDAGAQNAGAQNAGAGGSGLVQPSSFGPGTSVGGGSSSASAEDDAIMAPLLAKGGLSFFIAFCIGYALRTFLKGTMLVVGVVALAVFGLQKAGLVDDINWDKAQGYWDSLTANLGEQFANLKTFVTGSLPSAGSGGIGLLAGFRR